MGKWIHKIKILNVFTYKLYAPDDACMRCIAGWNHNYKINHHSNYV